jgi:hypothetical protein
VRAISLWEPWASLIAIGAKRIETRSWSTDYRGPLAIHASKRLTGEQRRQSSEPRFASVLQAAGILPSNGLMPTLGPVLCIVDLVACIPTDNLVGLGGEVDVDSDEFLFGNYAPGRYGWKLANLRPIDPLPFKGAQGFWWLPDNKIVYRKAAA